MRYFKSQTINPGDLVYVCYSNWGSFGVAIADTGTSFQYYSLHYNNYKTYIYGRRRSYMDRVIKVDPEYHLDADGIKKYQEISKQFVDEYQNNRELESI